MVSLGYAFLIVFAILCFLGGIVDVLNGVFRKEDTIAVGLSVLSVGLMALGMLFIFY